MSSMSYLEKPHYVIYVSYVVSFPCEARDALRSDFVAFVLRGDDLVTVRAI